MVYIKLFIDYLDAIEPLGDAERGRLFTALMEYAKTGEAPQLNGNERFIFPMMKAQLDRDIAANEETAERNRANGLKGGRPKKPTETQKTQVVFEKPTETNNKDKDKDYDEDEDEDYIPPQSPRGKRKKFVPPTLEEVIAYCKERNSPVDPKQFYDFFKEGKWVDSKGQKVRNWKQKLLTWEKYQANRIHVPSGREALEQLFEEFRAEENEGKELPAWTNQP